MFTKKRFAEILCVVAFCGTATVLVNLSHSAPQAAPKASPKAVVRNATDRDNVLAAAEAKRLKYLQDNHEARVLKMSKWHGSVTLPGVNATEANRPRFKAISDLFANEPPMPAPRKEQFAWLLAPESDPRCIGYRCCVEGVADTDQGTDVVLHVRPQILSARWPIVYCDQVCIETWHVSKDGKLTFVSAVPREPNAPTGISTLVIE